MFFIVTVLMHTRTKVLGFTFSTGSGPYKEPNLNDPGLILEEFVIIHISGTKNFSVIVKCEDCLYVLLKITKYRNSGKR